MLTSSIEARIFYRHSPDEVRALNAALTPLAEDWRVTTIWADRSKIRQILGGEYFLAEDAEMMCKSFRRAAKHARAHMDEYFPMMRMTVVSSAEALESAVDAYWTNFCSEQAHAIPTT